MVTGRCDYPGRLNELVCIPDHHVSNRGHKSHSKEKNRSGPGGREHNVTQVEQQEGLTVAIQPPVDENFVEIKERDQIRIVYSNGIANHHTGRFPNQGNPNQITAQNYRFSMSKQPLQNLTPTEVKLMAFGVAINGVPFDPGAAEWYLGDPQSGWNYNALAGAIPLGLDDNHAHVQPSGAYHYHGLPTGLLESLDLSSEKHSPIVGWAADGFPIYALYGFDSNSQEVVEMQSGFKLKVGDRPKGKHEPGGYHDGTFVEDYVYSSEGTDLDECNGRFTRTPEFPEGTYAYFLTNTFPVIPRCFMGTPSNSFSKRRA